MDFLKSVLMLICIASKNCSSDSKFDDFVKYVNDYINFTLNYQLPKDNAAMYLTHGENDTVNDYGTYDFIVIGGGSAGTVLTRRLAENNKYSVLLLEAGTLDDKFTDIPAMCAYTPNTPFNWGYKTVPQKKSCLGMENQQCLYPRGKVLGGSHVISLMTYIRGNRVDYDNWALKGNKGWSYNEILRFFKKTEHDDTNDPLHSAKYHGYDGLLHVNYSFPVPLNYEKLQEAYKICGYEETDINGESQIGMQKVPWTVKGNKRNHGGNAYVEPIMGLKNLKVALKAFVTELIIEGDAVTGVKFIKNNKLHKAMAKKEYILSAGAINSPQILMLSGIGPKDELEHLGIHVKNDLPVGKYLVDQPMFIGLYIRTNQTYPNRSMAENLARYVAGETPLTSPYNTGHVAFINTKSPGKNPPNIELLHASPPLGVPGDFKMAFNLDNLTEKPYSSHLNALTDSAVFVVLMKPKSQGTLKLQSKSPVDFPLIDPNFLSDKDDIDIQTMYEGIQHVLNLTKTAPLRSVNATVIASSPRCEHLRHISEQQYWYCALRQLTTTIYHPVGTTKMGVAPRNSVVDAEFRVHSMKKLRVCDAGAMPDAVTGHPIAAVMMMAEKLSHILKKQYSLFGFFN